MESNYSDSETSRRKETRQESPDIEAGFNGEVVDKDMNFPFKASGGRDIMSIIMKRHVGGGDVIEDDTEPVVKKARLTCEDTASVSVADVQEEEDTSSDVCDSEIAFNEIKANIDLLNGKESFTNTTVFSMIKCEDDTAKAVSSSQVIIEKKDNDTTEAPDFKIEVNDTTEAPYIKLEVDDIADAPDIQIKVNDTEEAPEMRIEVNNIAEAPDIKGEVDDSVEAPYIKIEVDDIAETPDIKIERNDSVICVDKCNESNESRIKQAVKTDIKIKQEPQELPEFVQDESHFLFDIVEPSGNPDSSMSSDYHITSSSKSTIGSSESVEFNTNITCKQEIDSDNESDISSSQTKDISKETLTEDRNKVILPSDLDVLAAAAESQQQIDTNHRNTQEPGQRLIVKITGKKKSRKQNTPRRITHIDFPEIDGETEKDDIDDEQRVEKSRKQFKPQRVTDAFIDYEDQFDEDKGIIKSKRVKGNDYEPENTDSADETYYTNSPDQKPKSHIFSGGNFSMMNMAGIPPGLQPHIPGQSMLPGSPFHNEMFATLSQTIYQTAAEKGQTGISNLEENLDVVRRLREIRFYKYRKISVAEKQEIAAYAKLHSASAAAAHFGVSKSAVSMWTRTDFSDMKDEPGKRKRNCMLGNEKFEQLLERVKSQKGNKFKALTKQDKFEVSRYAKLVGVREMARCLGIALGTVSGWMRQFPYTVKPANQEEESLNMSADVNDDSINNSQDNILNVSVKLENDESQSCDSEGKASDVKSENADTKEEALNQYIEVKLEKPDYTEGDGSQSEGSEQHKYLNDCPSDAWGDDSNSKSSTETLEYVNEDSDNDTDTESQSADKNACKDENESEIPEKNDEVDEMIAETLMTPDIDQCYENIRDQIKDTPLENDLFFESLFRRVLSCRTDKYKTLKASEKLEVVRYAKRIGVRKVAKLLGLATGTLSGWNTKYQGHLGLTMDGSSTPGTNPNLSLDMSQSSETPGSSSPNVFTPDSLNSTAALTPQSSSVLDNAEKSEVWAIKFLLKDQFPVLQEKIAIARQVKFRNIKPSEKIEIVKCAKLLGIRPTARVLGMPIGTLSGWMTKYTNTLHPVYHIGATEHVDYKANMTSNVPLEHPSMNDYYQNDLVGRNLTGINSPHSSMMASPVNHMSPYGFGVLPEMPNSYPQTLISGLSSPADPSSCHQDEVTSGSSEESGQNNPENLTSTEVTSNVGIVSVAHSSNMTSIDEHTKKIAEQYVRMFHESQNM